MFKTLIELQPKGVSSGEGAASPQQVAEATANELLDKFGDKAFDTEDLIRNMDEMGPVSAHMLITCRFHYYISTPTYQFLYFFSLFSPSTKMSSSRRWIS